LIKTEAFYDLLWMDETEDGRRPLAFGPVLALGSTTGNYQSFKENGAGILNLTYMDEHAYQTVVGLGGAGKIDTYFDQMHVEASLNVLWESVSGNRAIDTRARLDVANAVFKPTSAAIDANRLAVGTDVKFHLGEDVYAQIRYDTTHSENLIEHEGWAGITIRF
ncbi:MAG: autotransporter outer membrane beta-barrel domain-containing protein, partial [Pseudomonadota bacterium]